MKKILLSLGVIVLFGGYALYQHKQDSAQVVSIPSPITTSPSADPVAAEPPPSPEPVNSPVPTPSPKPAPSPAPSGKFKNGQYIGSVADAFYGNIQVRATVSGGKLTNVEFLQYPNDRSQSLQINREADPILASEAITAQSANVDIVSGATASSEAFRQSLDAALTQAVG